MSVFAIHTSFVDNSQVAHGEVNIFDEFTAYGNFVDWNEIFTASSSGHDLYFLVHDKLTAFPKNDALREVAQKYGLTTDEAKQVIDGSVTPIFNNPARRSAQLTLEDAYILVENLQEDFNEIHEILLLSQEVDVLISPSEIFTNGSLSDSGFDLVYDLSVIEEILFVETEQTTVGDPYGDALSSPYLPTDYDQQLENYVGTEGDGDILSMSFGLEVSEDGDEATFNIGDEAVSVDVLEEDVCPSDNSLLDALNEYEANNAGGEEGVGLSLIHI